MYDKQNGAILRSYRFGRLVGERLFINDEAAEREALRLAHLSSAAWVFEVFDTGTEMTTATVPAAYV